MRLVELEGRGRVKFRNKASPFHTFILRPFSLAVSESLLQRMGPRNLTWSDKRDSVEFFKGFKAFSKTATSPHLVMGVPVMSLNLYKAKPPDRVAEHALRRPANAGNPVVLMVEDRKDTRSLMKQVLERNGYRVIDTDNGLDAASRAQYIHPDLVLVDLDVPLLYELVAARQIVKQAQLGVVPVVIITHEEVMDPYPLMEVGVRRNEYVTRLSDYEQLEHLLDYLLPVEPQAA